MSQKFISCSIFRTQDIHKSIFYINNYQYLHKYKNFHTRERPIIVNPPPDTAVPKPSLISVSRCTIQQNNTAIIVKIDDNEVNVNIDSYSSNERINSSNIQNKVLLVWSGKSDLESLKKKNCSIINHIWYKCLLNISVSTVCNFNLK